MHVKFLFFGKFGVLCFLEAPVLRFAILALLPTNFDFAYRASISIKSLFSALKNDVSDMNFKPFRDKKILLL